MKKLLLMMVFAALAFVACDKDNFEPEIVGEEYGTLSLNDASFVVSEETVTRTTTTTTYSYYVWVLDAAGNEVDIDKSSDNKYLLFSSTNNIPEISLPANDDKNQSYTLRIMTAENISEAPSFSSPVYGAEATFTIKAGETTEIGSITCTLWKQCIVTIGYNEYFLKHLNGEATAAVTVNNSNALVYNVTGNETIQPTQKEDRLGYFLVPKDNGSDDDKNDETTMQVEFKGKMKVKKDDGTYEYKNQKMRFGIDGIKARQWHKVFIYMEEDKDGNANFSIEIDGLVEDAELVENVSSSDVESESLGTDPNKPKGDGGIRLDWTTGGTDEEMTQWNNDNDIEDGKDYINKPAITIDALNELVFTATIPNNVKIFTVDISGTPEFEYAVNLVAPGGHIDLVEDTQIVERLSTFGINFPSGDAITSVPDDGEDKTIVFDLTSAIATLIEIPYTGTHTFSMYIQDTEGCSNRINLNLTVATTTSIK